MRNPTALIVCGMLAVPLLSTQAAHLGQTEASVLQEHGAPKSALNKGTQRILIYPEGRIKLDQGTVVEVTGKLTAADSAGSISQPSTMESPKRAPQSSGPSPMPAHLKPIVADLVDVRHMPMDNPDLEKQRFVLIYYAEGESLACERATQRLRYYYGYYKTGNNFEVLFVSADPSARKMTNHMAKQSMPWPAIRYDAIERSGLLKLRGTTLPAMALINAEGQLIASSEVDGVYKGVGSVLDALTSRL